MKLSTETLMIEIQSVVLETDELESQKQAYAYASFEFLGLSSFRWEH